MDNPLHKMACTYMHALSAFNFGPMQLKWNSLNNVRSERPIKCSPDGMQLHCIT